MSIESITPDTLLDNRYKIIKSIGSGGFGQTYLATDTKLPPNSPHATCVVKQLKPLGASYEVAKRLFDREALTLAKLGKHDQIPTLLAHLSDQGDFFLVLERVDGDDLTQEIRAGFPLSEADVQKLLWDVLSVLKVVHDEDVIHRDLKPSNVMRRRSDRKIVLIDFGAVKEVVHLSPESTEQTITSTVPICTKGYSPPEQRHGHPRLSSDIYAVGMMAIQALGGFRSDELEGLFNQTIGEYEWRDRVSVSKGLADVIEKMVRYDYRQRYSNATEVLNALMALTNVASGTATVQESSSTTPIQPATALAQTAPTVTYYGTYPAQPIVPGNLNPATISSEPEKKSNFKWIFIGVLTLVIVSLGGGVAATLYIQSLFSNQNPEPSPESSPVAVNPESAPAEASPLPTEVIEVETSANSPAVAAATTRTVSVDLEPLNQALSEQRFGTANEISSRVLTELLGGEYAVVAAEKIPCTDLLALDQAWLENSNGRFGLTVQSAAWQQIAANTADIDTAFQLFKTKVGWRKVNHSFDQRLSELNYSALATEGHLPTGTFTATVGRHTNPLFPYILERFIYCKAQQSPQEAPTN